MKNKDKFAIIGAGGFGREIFHLFNNDKYYCIGFIDIEKKEKLPVPILGHEDDMSNIIFEHGLLNCVIAIGDMVKRKNIYKKIKNFPIVFPKMIDSSINYHSVNIEEGGIIYPGVVLMNDCNIGRFTLINSGATLGHDVIIGDFCNINPGVHLAGRITIGDSTLIGIGASIKEGVTIGKNAIIGAGSVVLNDVPNNTTVYGVPARSVISE